MTSRCPVKVINHFTFDTGEIFELEFCNIAQDAAKKDRYQWYFVHALYRSELKFVSRTSEERVFTFTDVFYDGMEWTVVLNTQEMTVKMSHNHNPQGGPPMKIRTII